MFELHRREGGGKGIYCSAQNNTLFVDLLENILIYIIHKMANFSLLNLWTFVFVYSIVLFLSSKDEFNTFEYKETTIRKFFIFFILRSLLKVVFFTVLNNNCILVSNIKGFHFKLFDIKIVFIVLIFWRVYLRISIFVLKDYFLSLFVWIWISSL